MPKYANQKTIIFDDIEKIKHKKGSKEQFIQPIDFKYENSFIALFTYSFEFMLLNLLFETKNFFDLECVRYVMISFSRIFCLYIFVFSSSK